LYTKSKDKRYTSQRQSEILNISVDVCFIDKILLNLIDNCLIEFKPVKRIEG